MSSLHHQLRYNSNSRTTMRSNKAANPQLLHHPRPAAVSPYRPARAARRLCAQPANVAAGLPPSSPQPPSSPRSTKKPAKLASSSSSLPIMLAGLSGGVLIGAAALHLGGDVDHAATLASAAASAVTPLRELGPSEVLAQGFGPTRPLWSALLHSHQVTAAAASAAHHATAGSLIGGGGVGGGVAADNGAAASLISEARGAAEGAVTAVRGAVGGLCDEYNHWLAESPLACKIVTGNFFTVAGDMLAQLGLGGAGGHGGGEEVPSGEVASGGKRKVDWMRTGRLCLETSAFGTPLGHWWFNLLDTRIMPDNPHCPTAVLTKMLADQVLFAPLGLLMFFAVIKCLEGKPRDLPHTLRTSYVTALLGGYLLWPVAGILNFALLPPEYRLLFNNCVNIIWTCFLSVMSSGGAAGKDANATTAAEPATSTVLAPPPSSSSCCATAAAASSHTDAVAAVIETAVLMAAVSAAAAAGRPSFGYVTGLAAAAIEVALSACAAPELAPVPVAPVPVVVLVAEPPPLFVPSFAAGASVSVGSPCLELYEQPVDALYETR